MRARLPGESTTWDTRHESNESVDRARRELQIARIMRDAGRPLSAKEIAVLMRERGYASTDERNLAAPRLTEMERRGIVEVVGSVKCSYSGKKVSVYALVTKSE